MSVLVRDCRKADRRCACNAPLLWGPGSSLWYGRCLGSNARSMAHIIFYEKPRCLGNARQRALLEAAGHDLDVRDLSAVVRSPKCSSLRSKVTRRECACPRPYRWVMLRARVVESWPMTAPNPKVDAFVSRAKRWQSEIQKLREILLACGLDEELKWGKPCFVFEGTNVAIIQPFKGHCSLMFFKGALLEDKHGLLKTQGEHTQSALRLEFTSEAQIKKAVVKAYVKAAIAVERAGLEVDFKARRELELPEELTQIFGKDRKLATAFHALTPGRQRGYVMHFSAAKQSKTRIARIEKCAPKILAGKGMNDH